MNKSYKCDFCKFDSGPLMTPNPKCEHCSCGGFFELKKRMSQRQTHEWETHQKLDCFIDRMGIKVLAYQREILHLMVNRKVYITIPPQMGRTNFRILMAYYKAIYESEENKKEKENGTNEV